MAREPGFAVAPASAPAGSGDVTITVLASSFHSHRRHDLSEVVLPINGENHTFSTTFVDSWHLTAVIPEALLTKPVVGVVSVFTGDPMDEMTQSGAADFTVAQ